MNEDNIFMDIFPHAYPPQSLFIPNILTRLNQEGRYVLDFVKMTPTIVSSSAYNFCRPGPTKTFADQDRQNVEPDLDPNCLTLW